MTGLFSGALRQHLDGNLESAEARYREHLHINPDDPQGRHYLGFLLQQTDRLDEAAEQLAAAIALDDTHSAWHFNLGITRLKQNLLTAAITAFEHAITLDPGQYFYWTNLGTAFELNQELLRAGQCYQSASNLNPDCPDAYYLLSALCLKQQRFQEARHYNYCGIIAEPEDKKSKVIRAQACYELGQQNEAIAIFENWLKDEPDNPVAMHLLAAYLGQQAKQCCEQYIERTFDEFANSFEHILMRLKYCGPQLVKDHLATLNLSALNVLDSGCGTGLIGEVLKPYARELTGVDLSAAMLEKAAEKHCYHQLHKADITDFLQSSNEQYDLITCMDTFIYIGDLQQVFTLMIQNLKVGGQLIFSTEKLADARDYQLNISGRYSHHPDYLTNILDTTGFNLLKITDVIIRTESGCPIQGQFVCASRTT